MIFTGKGIGRGLRELTENFRAVHLEKNGIGHFCHKIPALVFSPYYHKMPNSTILCLLILMIFCFFFFAEMCYIATVKSRNYL